MRHLAIERAAATGWVVIALSRTWRFRDSDEPDEPPDEPRRPVIFAGWHEFLLPGAFLGAGWGAAALASQGRDGELISRVAGRAGLVSARGSTSRGGGQGFRELVRALRAGRSVLITPDGPRGPRHVCHPGVIRLAAVTGVPIVPLGLAAMTGHRLRSWDRCLIPAPGTRIYVFRGAEIHVPGSPEDEPALALALGLAISRAVKRCEAVAEEARWRRPYRIRHDCDAPGRTIAPGGRTGREMARRIEPGLRRAWRRVPPPTGLRIASGAFALARTMRNRLYQSGILQMAHAPLPVVSVGGVTVGGSGKTPLASLIGGWLTEEGHRVAVLTRGYPDEMRLHRALLPAVDVWGHPDRVALARRAAAAGATVAVLDDGFQHRCLARDFDILALDRDALRRTNGASLPAGPFRERPVVAARRADAVVLVGREPWSDELADFDRSWAERLGPGKLVASLWIRPGPPVLMRGDPLPDTEGPTVALTGVMKPNLFFELAESVCSTLARRHTLPDHGLPGREWPELLEAAAGGGLLITRKDYMRLCSCVPAEIPIWVLPERLEWRSRELELRHAVLGAAGSP